MYNLIVPDALATEFATVKAIWAVDAKTRCVDALILTWVKYEKQTRRLFTYLVLQHPELDDQARAEVDSAIAGNNRLYPRQCLSGIEALGGQSMAVLLGPTYAQLSSHITRIQGYRNKIFHGQLTGRKLTALQLSADVHHLIAWVDALGVTALRAFGYDGLARNTRRLAGTRPAQHLNFPFNTSAEFSTWLRRLTG